MPVSPPRWSKDRLEEDRLRAIAKFREERVDEPLEDYLGFFQKAREAVENVLEASRDLIDLRLHSPDILVDAGLHTAVRYLAGPPLSEDDWRTLAETTLATTLIERDNDRARRLVDVILHGLDRERFPWLAENREATDAEREMAIVSTSAMMAMRKTETERRNTSNRGQEGALKQFLVEECGFVEVPKKVINNMSDAPPPGHFCGEIEVAGRKADVPIRLWDGRLMAVECKVSGSATNSVKRVANDAAAKATKWLVDLGTANCVPTALMGGVFSLTTLEFCQERELTLFWDHDFAPLGDFIERTKP